MHPLYFWSQSYEFARYEQAPSDIQAKEIEARASKVDKADE